jgi:hypothetical protein
LLSENGAAGEYSIREIREIRGSIPLVAARRAVFFLVNSAFVAPLPPWASLRAPAQTSLPDLR